jgi:hypothetical protein
VIARGGVDWDACAGLARQLGRVAALRLLHWRRERAFRPDFVCHFQCRRSALVLARNAVSLACGPAITLELFAVSVAVISFPAGRDQRTPACAQPAKVFLRHWAVFDGATWTGNNLGNCLRADDWCGIDSATPGSRQRDNAENAKHRRLQ